MGTLQGGAGASKKQVGSRLKILYQPSIFDGWYFFTQKWEVSAMDCPNKNCKYYKKKEKARYFMGVDMSGGGYCTRGYCEKQFRRKRK